jgi:hypothetical protein
LGASKKQYNRKVSWRVKEKKKKGWRFLRRFLQKLKYSKERATWTLLRVSFDK